MADLTQQEWAAQLANETDAIVLDVRTDEEVAEGYIRNARQLNIMAPQEFMQGLDGLDPSKPYYVYCRSGNRSGQACVIMKSRGFSTVYNLLGGIMEWNGELVTEPMNP
jgi:rhodanese-related sulfurtransferase